MTSAVITLSGERVSSWIFAKNGFAMKLAVTLGETRFLSLPAYAMRRQVIYQAPTLVQKQRSERFLDPCRA